MSLNIVLFTVLMTAISAATKIQYIYTQTPPRAAMGTKVILNIQIKGFVAPLGEVKLVSASSSHEWLAVSENGQCTITDNSIIKSVILCDNKNGNYSIHFKDIISATAVNDFKIIATKQIKVSNKFRFKTYVKPNKVVITQGKSLVSQAGQKVQLNCSFEGGENNEASFEWKKLDAIDGSVVALPVSANDSSTKEDSEINWVGLKEDSGWYQCIADYDPSSVGQFKSESIELDVQYTPRLDLSQAFDSVQIAEIGDKVKIKMFIISNPLVTEFHWQKREKFLVESRFDTEELGKLSFTVKESDYGVYEFMAKNELGWNTFYVDVQKPKALEFGIWQFTTIGFAVGFLILLLVIVVIIVCFCRKNCRKEDPYTRRIVEKTQVSDIEINGIDNIDSTYMEMEGGYDDSARPSAQNNPDDDYVIPSEFLEETARTRPQAPLPPLPCLPSALLPDPNTSAQNLPPKVTKKQTSRFGRFRRPKQADTTPNSAPSTPPPPIPKNAKRPLPTPGVESDAAMYELEDPSPVRNIIGWINNKNH